MGQSFDLPRTMARTNTHTPARLVLASSVGPCGRQSSREGGVAQMVERSLSMREVRGSMPRTSTLVIFCIIFRFRRLSVVPFHCRIEQAYLAKGTCRNPGSNQGHLDLQSNALPTELFRLCTVGIPSSFINVAAGLHCTRPATGAIVTMLQGLQESCFTLSTRGGTTGPIRSARDAGPMQQ